ncbi:uncharacterized protein FMAN_02074 [Fusarium mangiferae]|uniref:Uncharacterized protein n=1 Tax=Fusarium mangiferae TaxID=192010 RepID=A0A1L7SMX9_FUSMA|nr:uncharacterized protein FMAN_02074 [Fusarium mangiferae]CVK85174.1 uncharacterized protein FMAN_02074 [Fusarium mangiferae]
MRTRPSSSHLETLLEEFGEKVQALLLTRKIRSSISMTPPNSIRCVSVCDTQTKTEVRPGIFSRRRL